MEAEYVALRCPRCDEFVADGEVKTVRSGWTELRTCPKCTAPLVAERSRVAKPIVLTLAVGALRSLRPLTLLVSLGVLAASIAASYAPFGAAIGAGLQVGWFFAVLRAASRGDDDPEVDPTDLSARILAWIAPAVRYTLAFVVALGPSLVAALVLGESGMLFAGALFFLGAVQLPAGLIVAAHSPAWYAPLNPVPAVRLIFRIPGPYAVAFGMLVGLSMLGTGGVAVAHALDLGVASDVLAATAQYMPMVAAARLLGTLVYECREEL